MKQVKQFAPYFFIIAVVGLVYFGTLGYSFTYDDQHYIVESEYIKGWKAYLSIFRKDYFSVSPEHVDLTRPLMPFSLTLDHKIWSESPFGYHLTNVILHALNSVVLYNLACSMAKGWAPLMASLLFAVHPIHVEPVVGITFREDLLVTFFFLSSLLSYISFKMYSKKSQYLFSFLFFLLALLSKEMAVTLPLVLLVYNYFLQKQEGEGIKWRDIFPYLSLLPIYLLFLYYVYSNLPSPPTYVGSFSAAIQVNLKVILYYIKLLLFPFNLHVDYNISPFFDRGIIVFTIILATTSLLYLLWYKDKALSFCISLFFITLLPVLNIVPTFRLIADRFLYLPSIGFCIFIAITMTRIFEGLSVTFLRRASKAMLAGVLVLWAGALFDRSRVWENDFILWSDVLKKSPASVRAYTAIGAYYIQEGRDNEALAMLQKAVEIMPDYDKAYYNIGAIYMRKGYLDAAATAFKKAVETSPDYAKAHFNIGIVLAAKGDYNGAISEYEKALKLMPENAVLYNNIGNAYSAKGIFDKALAAYRAAVEIEPEYSDAYYNMGNAFAKMERYSEAVNSYKKAITLNPINASAFFNLGNVYLFVNRVEDAKDAFKRALAVNPEHQGARNVLGLIDKEIGSEKQ